MAMIFIPGMKPGHVSGAAGSSHVRERGPRIVSGSAFRGNATPRGLVPFEMPKTDHAKAKRQASERARDVADAYHFERDQPQSAKERRRDVKAAAAEVAAGAD